MALSKTDWENIGLVIDGYGADVVAAVKGRANAAKEAWNWVYFMFPVLATLGIIQLFVAANNLSHPSFAIWAALLPWVLFIWSLSYPPKGDDPTSSRRLNGAGWVVLGTAIADLAEGRRGARIGTMLSKLQKLFVTQGTIGAALLLVAGLAKATHGHYAFQGRVIIICGIFSAMAIFAESRARFFHYAVLGAIAVSLLFVFSCHAVNPSGSPKTNAMDNLVKPAHQVLDDAENDYQRAYIERENAKRGVGTRALGVELYRTQPGEWTKVEPSEVKDFRTYRVGFDAKGSPLLIKRDFDNGTSDGDWLPINQPNRQGIVAFHVYNPTTATQYVQPYE